MFEISKKLCNGKMMYCDGDCENCHSKPKIKYPKIKRKHKSLRERILMITQQLHTYSMYLYCYEEMKEIGLTVSNVCIGRILYTLDNQAYIHAKCFKCPYYHKGSESIGKSM